MEVASDDKFNMDGDNDLENESNQPIEKDDEEEPHYETGAEEETKGGPLPDPDEVTDPEMNKLIMTAEHVFQKISEKLL